MPGEWKSNQIYVSNSGLFIPENLWESIQVALTDAADAYGMTLPKTNISWIALPEGGSLKGRSIEINNDSDQKFCEFFLEYLAEAGMPIINITNVPLEDMFTRPTVDIDLNKIPTVDIKKKRDELLDQFNKETNPTKKEELKKQLNKWRFANLKKIMAEKNQMHNLLCPKCETVVGKTDTDEEAHSNAQHRITCNKCLFSAPESSFKLNKDAFSQLEAMALNIATRKWEAEPIYDSASGSLEFIGYNIKDDTSQKVMTIKTKTTMNKATLEDIVFKEFGKRNSVHAILQEDTSLHKKGSLVKVQAVDFTNQKVSVQSFEGSELVELTKVALQLGKVSNMIPHEDHADEVLSILDDGLEALVFCQQDGKSKWIPVNREITEDPIQPPATPEAYPAAASEKKVKFYKKSSMKVLADTPGDLHEMELTVTLPVNQFLDKNDPEPSYAFELAENAVDLARKELEAEIKESLGEASSNVHIGQGIFEECDSGNISHANAYYAFNVVGPAELLEKLSQDMIGDVIETDPFKESSKKLSKVNQHPNSFVKKSEEALVKLQKECPECYEKFLKFKAEKNKTATRDNEFSVVKKAEETTLQYICSLCKLGPCSLEYLEDHLIDRHGMEFGPDMDQIISKSKLLYELNNRQNTKKAEETPQTSIEQQVQKIRDRINTVTQRIQTKTKLKRDIEAKKLERFWVVIIPTSQRSTLDDICFETTPWTVGDYFKGGLQNESILNFFDNEEEAKKYAEELLRGTIRSSKKEKKTIDISQMDPEDVQKLIEDYENKNYRTYTSDNSLVVQKKDVSKKANEEVCAICKGLDHRGEECPFENLTPEERAKRLKHANDDLNSDGTPKMDEEGKHPIEEPAVEELIKWIQLDLDMIENTYRDKPDVIQHIEDIENEIESLEQKLGLSRQQYLKADSIDSKEYLAQNTKTSPEVLKQLSKDNDPDVRWAVARNPSTPPEVLLQLSKDRKKEVRQAVAQNTKTPPEVLTQLSRDIDDDIRYEVAKNLNTPSEVLTQLSKDPDLRYRVADNPNTPTEVLTQLSKDKHRDVRWAVARNPKAPSEVLKQLSRDNDGDVRWAASRNPNTPPEVLKQLRRNASEIQNISNRTFWQRKKRLSKRDNLSKNEVEKESRKETKCVMCDKSSPIDQMVENVHGAGYLCQDCASIWNSDVKENEVEKESATRTPKPTNPPPQGMVWAYNETDGSWFLTATK
jgi:hypothetical protein